MVKYVIDLWGDNMANELKKFKSDLERSIKNAKVVFIVGHNESDFDAIGAAIGVSEICNHFDKKNYIILDDGIETMEPGVKKVKDMVNKNCKIINMNEYKHMIETSIPKTRVEEFYSLISEIRDKVLKKVEIKDSLLIVVDTNKKYLLANQEYLDSYNDIIVIDHHKTEEKGSIDATYSYISEEASSACEIVTRLLNMFKVKINKDTANALAAGIYLDTNRFKKNTSPVTYDVVEHLMLTGATTDTINKLFLQDFEADKIVNNLVFDNGNTQHFIKLLKNNSVSFTLNRTNPKTIYRKEAIAKAADKMQKYDSTDTSIVMGHVDEDTISVSIRSNGYIDCDKLIKGYCTDETRLGGGNEKAAGAKFYGKDILEEEKNLVEYLRNIDVNKIKVKKK